MGPFAVGGIVFASLFGGAILELRNSIARTVLLDRIMAHYGPETREARAQLRQFVETSLRQVWGMEGAVVQNPTPSATILGLSRFRSS
jgi:hypothetical protein